jgi:hypothetical protein
LPHPTKNPPLPLKSMLGTRVTTKRNPDRKNILPTLILGGAGDKNKTKCMWVHLIPIYIWWVLVDRFVPMRFSFSFLFLLCVCDLLVLVRVSVVTLFACLLVCIVCCYLSLCAQFVLSLSSVCVVYCTSFFPVDFISLRRTTNNLSRGVGIFIPRTVPQEWFSPLTWIRRRQHRRALVCGADVCACAGAPCVLGRRTPKIESPTQRLHRAQPTRDS